MYITEFIPNLLGKGITFYYLVLSGKDPTLNSRISADLLALAAPVNLEHVVWKLHI